MKKVTYNFPAALNEIMREKSILQIELAERTGLSRGYISELLQGKKNPELKTVMKICNALDVSINHFLILSASINSESDKRAALLDKIGPILSEMDELIYPDRYNGKSNPTAPINAKGTKLVAKASI